MSGAADGSTGVSTADDRALTSPHSRDHLLRQPPLGLCLGPSLSLSLSLSFFLFVCVFVALVSPGVVYIYIYIYMNIDVEL